MIVKPILPSPSIHQIDELRAAFFAKLDRLGAPCSGNSGLFWPRHKNSSDSQKTMFSLRERVTEIEDPVQCASRVSIAKGSVFFFFHSRNIACCKSRIRKPQPIGRLLRSPDLSRAFTFDAWTYGRKRAHSLFFRSQYTWDERDERFTLHHCSRSFSVICTYVYIGRTTKHESNKQISTKTCSTISISIGFDSLR